MLLSRVVDDAVDHNPRKPHGSAQHDQPADDQAPKPQPRWRPRRSFPDASHTPITGRSASTLRGPAAPDPLLAAGRRRACHQPLALTLLSLGSVHSSGYVAE